MLAAMTEVTISIGEENFRARLRSGLAPQSCERLLALLPYRGELIHARWSGEALWSRLAAVWPAGAKLPPENATVSPRPGDVLLYAGPLSEPELLVVYGSCRFAAKAGPLEGNPVLIIEDDFARLSEIGHQILHRGALPLRIALRNPDCEEP